MNWSKPKDVKAQLQRQWDRGVILQSAITGSDIFPLKLQLKKPTSADITNEFEAVRYWTAQLTNSSGLHLEWQEISHRVQGTQKLPSSVWIASLDDALDWLGKRQDWKLFLKLIETTKQICPQILPWLEKRPHKALELADDWKNLLAVINWIQVHPRPQIYLRQVDLSGIHSKFIELHRGILAELLDLVLPSNAINNNKTGTSQFAARYGFKEKPTHIRFRSLDPEISVIPDIPNADISLDSQNFSRLTLDIEQVIITENEINFLALPNNIAATIAIFGSGYGWDALAKAHWLQDCNIYYWGDIDTHGFAILDQLRSHFSHVTSLLMDRATLDQHSLFWGFEDKPQNKELSRLTREESRLYHDLKGNKIRKGLRLEQEYIQFNWVQQRLKQL